MERWEKHFRRDPLVYSLFHLCKYMCTENFPGLVWTQSHTQFGGRIPCEISKMSFQNYRVSRVNLIFQGFAWPCFSFPSVPSTPHKIRFNFKLQQHNSGVSFWTTLTDKLPHGDYVLFWLLNVLDKFFGMSICRHAQCPSNLLWTYRLKNKKRERRKKVLLVFHVCSFIYFSPWFAERSLFDN